MSSPKFGSTHIAKVGYDDEAGALLVEFHRGGTYIYPGVDSETFSALYNSHSPGSLFRSRILPYHKGKRL